MGVISTIRSYGEAGVVQASKTLNTILNNSSAVKKTCQVVKSSLSAINFYFDSNYLPGLSDHVKNTRYALDFYSTFKLFVYWVNPFQLSDKKVQERAYKSLDAESSITLSTGFKEKFWEANKNLVGHEAACEALKNALQKEGVDETRARNIANKALELKSRSYVELFAKACHTMSSLALNFLTLERWKIVDLTKIANQVGSVGVFSFVKKMSLETFCGVSGVIGIGTGIGMTVNKLLEIRAKESRGETIDAKTKTENLWELVTGSLDFLYVGLPLFFTLNPPMLITLSLVSKSAGLLQIFANNK